MRRAQHRNEIRYMLARLNWALEDEIGQTTCEHLAGDLIELDLLDLMGFDAAFTTAYSLGWESGKKWARGQLGGNREERRKRARETRQMLKRSAA